MAFITRLSKSSKRLFGTLLLALSLNAAAEGISVTRSEAKLTETGQLSVSSRFRTDLPDQLKQALRQGVPLNFTLSWQLSAPSMPSYRFKFDQLLNSDNTIHYKLSFHPLTNRYRITVGTFSTEYDTLETALRGRRGGRQLESPVQRCVKRRCSERHTSRNPPAALDGEAAQTLPNQRIDF